MTTGGHVRDRRVRQAGHQERQLSNHILREARARFVGSEGLARMEVMRRARLGLTQAALAEQLGTTPSVIARMERGQHQVDEGNRRQIVQALAGS
ncbi:MAG TPA: helix-turn-helix transcriptional regulator [Acidimicrobiales bacterium]|nr:helix-turn-helix transcriptional regulator [Acidimicrobiales bacterium]